MEHHLSFFIFLLSFGVIALASRQIGEYCTRFKFPLISGFLAAGIVVGPFVLGLIPQDAIQPLGFINEVALASIAFTAGSELYLKDFRDRFKSITWVTVGQLVVTFSLGTLALCFLADSIPSMRHLPLPARLAAALLAASILVARSPSSAIAIVKEMRAKGPFTRMVLGVTVIMDVVVIIVFAISSEVAGALLTDFDFSPGFVTLLTVEFLIALLVGCALWKVLVFILSRSMSSALKAASMLLAGYGVFVFSVEFRRLTHEHWPFEVLLEPLLICMIAGLLVTNASKYRAEFSRILHDIGPTVYIAFFTLTGASLALDVLALTWGVALALFAVRLVSMFVGSLVGGTLAGDPALHNRIGWMGFVTQAGVGIGLAKSVAVQFPEWGAQLATLVIAVIVLNQLVGPPLFKWAINLVRESHTRADTPEFDRVRDAIIFGSGGGESLTLARQLRSHGWKVTVASRVSDGQSGMAASDVEMHPISEISLDVLRQLDVANAEAIVVLLSDDENYTICELVYEHFGTETVVARLHDRAHLERLRELGVLVVDPSTAIVHLLEHFVLSPTATSMVLGMDEDQEVVEIEVCDPDLDGVALRDLRLPLDALVLSVHRDGHTLISHGYTRLKLGDRVTVVGPPDNLEEVMLLFEASSSERVSPECVTA